MEKSNDILERVYWELKHGYLRTIPILRTVILRTRKFIALPYCYFRFIDWNECTASRYKVIIDYLYIFFKLKYYPENYGYCRLWEKTRDDWKYYYGSNYDAYQSYKLGKEVQRKEYQILFRDKEVCHQLCTGAGLNVPRIYCVIDPDDDYVTKLNTYLNENNKLIIKPVIGHGGHGVQLIEKINGTILNNNNERTNLDNLIFNERHLVQEFIKQDDRLTILTPSASIRLITLYTKSYDVIILSAEINTAVGDNVVSNWSAGGIGIGVDIESGRLKESGYDKQGHIHTIHPTTKIRFSDYVIPEWNQIVDFAIKIQKTFPYYKMLGPDITLSANGPMLYEINATPDIASTEQLLGPLLANKKILQEFKKYDLLINNTFSE